MKAHFVLSAVIKRLAYNVTFLGLPIMSGQKKSIHAKLRT